MAVERVFDRRTYFTGQRIFSQGDAGFTMYFVERGKILISRGNESDPELIGEVRSGGIFGEMALIDGQPRMAIPQAVFQQKMQSSDPFIRALVRIMLTNLRNANDQLYPKFQQPAA
jgi:CRP-like cAMP-binding protein